MKSRLLRTFSASLLCLCALTGLSGCMELTMHPATRAWKKQQEEQMRQLTEAQNQQVAQQREQEKSNAAQVAKVAEPKQEQPVVKAQEPPKTNR